MSEPSIVGLSVAQFTILHVLISILALGSGLLTLFGMARGRAASKVTYVFLVTTAATSLTGFMFPAPFDPADAIGVLSLLSVGVAALALFRLHQRGLWGWLFAAGTATALYLNIFVAVVQAFQKVPVLHLVAPTQSAPAFAVTQGLVLIGFATISFVATRHFMAVSHPPVPA